MGNWVNYPTDSPLLLQHRQVGYTTFKVLSSYRLLVVVYYYIDGKNWVKCCWCWWVVCYWMEGQGMKVAAHVPSIGTNWFTITTINEMIHHILIYTCWMISIFVLIIQDRFSMIPLADESGAIFQNSKWELNFFDLTWNSCCRFDAAVGSSDDNNFLFGDYGRIERTTIEKWNDETLRWVAL